MHKIYTRAEICTGKEIVPVPSKLREVAGKIIGAIVERYREEFGGFTEVDIVRKIIDEKLHVFRIPPTDEFWSQTRMNCKDITPDGNLDIHVETRLNEAVKHSRGNLFVPFSIELDPSWCTPRFVFHDYEQTIE